MYLLLALRRALDPEGCVLVGHDVVFVFRVERLKVLRDEDVFVGELVAGFGKVLEKVGVVGGMEMEVGCVGIARLLVGQPG